MIDIYKFCRKSDYSDLLTKPFSDSEYTYASDGHILIRTNRILEITDVGSSVRTREIFESNKINADEVWIDLPEFKVSEKNCLYCKGVGIISGCPECGGIGRVKISNDYSDYIVDCKFCDGREIKNEKCENCEGIGKYKEYSNPIVVACVSTVSNIRVNGIQEKAEVMLNGMYLDMVKDLPNIKIALQLNDDFSFKPVKLKFDGGIGLLMPMNFGK